MNTGTKYGVYLLYLFLIASAFCTLILLRGFLRWLPDITDTTDSRYYLLSKHYASVPEISYYVDTHLKRPPLYSQVYWMIIDGWPAYTIVPYPGARISAKIANYNRGNVQELDGEFYETR